MINKILIYTSKSYNPYENLAAEKVLFDNVKNDETILYLWQNKNTVVIGKNQNAYAECPTELLKKDGIFLARRLSGGGAVFHDMGNLNFTFIAASENYSLQKNIEVISLACKKAGIDTEISGRNDILADGRKFSGNAFYNSNGKSYHHGTLLIDADMEKMQSYLSPSKAKLEAKGVKSVRSRVINLKEINPLLSCDMMKVYMAEAFNEVYSIEAAHIDDIDTLAVESLRQKYSDWDYLYGAQPPFTFSFEERFEWGSVDLKINVEKGRIKEIKAYTDAMDCCFSEKIEKNLADCRFEIGAINEALKKEMDPQIAEDIIKLFENALR